MSKESGEKEPNIKEQMHPSLEIGCNETSGSWILANGNWNKWNDSIS